MNKLLFLVVHGFTLLRSMDLSAQEVDPEHAASALLKNPVAVTAESLAKGKTLYDHWCQACPGPDGKAGLAIGYLKLPPNLTDDQWDYGSSDGEIFDTIQYGVPPDYNMEPWVERLDDKDTWSLVNYIRSLYIANQ